MMQKQYVRAGDAHLSDEGMESYHVFYDAADVEAALKELAAKWLDEIAVVYNEYSGGQRAGLTQAAAELRSLMDGSST